MDVFKNLSSKLKEVFGGTKRAKMQKSDIATAVDGATTAVRGLMQMVQDTLLESTLKKMAVAIKRKEFKGPANQKALDVYELYRKALPQQEIATENTMYLGAIIKMLPTMISDLTLIDKNFNKIFSNMSSPDESRVSHAYAIGYVHLAEMTTDFFNTMVYLINADKTERPPGYMYTQVEKQAPIIGAFLGYLLKRGGSDDIMKDIGKLQKSGTDVFLMTNGQTIDAYAQASDYPQMTQHVMANGFTMSPIMLLGDGVLLVQRYILTRRKNLREWVAAKISLINMELDGIDPNDPEYKRLQNVLKNYTEIITDLDRKIAKHESS